MSRWVQGTLLLAMLSMSTGFSLRKHEVTNSMLTAGDPGSLISVSNRVLASSSSDWWLWVVIAGLVAAAVFITVTFWSPGVSESTRSNDTNKLVVNGKISSCQQVISRSSPEIDPTLIGITVRGRLPTGDFIELFNATSAHETGEGSKFKWDDANLSWIIERPATATVITEMMVSIEQYSSSGGLTAIIATGTVQLKPPIAGSPMTVIPKAQQVVELKSTGATNSSAGSLWGSMELSVDYQQPGPDATQLSIAQKQILKKLKVVRPLFLASHSLAVVLVILDSFFGIRFLFSGCFASSVQAIVSAGLISMLSIPMAAEWGQMHYNLPPWLVKIGRLNSQFKATVLLACAIPQSVLASFAGSGNCRSFFSTVGILTYIDFGLFCALFVQSEANGHIGALFHLNCFKRPLPPAGAEKLIPSEKDAKKFLASQPGSGSPPSTSAASSTNNYPARRQSTVAPAPSTNPTSYAAARRDSRRASMRS